MIKNGEMGFKRERERESVYLIFCTQQSFSSKIGNKIKRKVQRERERERTKNERNLKVQYLKPRIIVDLYICKL